MLIDYINTMGNFNEPYIKSAFYASGYFGMSFKSIYILNELYASDLWNCNLEEFLTAEEGPEIVARERTSYLTSDDANWSVYELIFRPPAGILNSSTPLIQKTELILSFDES